LFALLARVVDTPPLPVPQIPITDAMALLTRAWIIELAAVTWVWTVPFATIVLELMPAPAVSCCKPAGETDPVGNGQGRDHRVLRQVVVYIGRLFKRKVHGYTRRDVVSAANVVELRVIERRTGKARHHRGRSSRRSRSIAGPWCAA
jgi:hypothetical protein